MTPSSRNDEAIESLQTIPLFAQMGEKDLESLAAHVIERHYPKNTTIVEEGLPGDYMYVIREGRVKVTKLSDDGREKILEFLDGGAFFGEMALFEHLPRVASIKTLNSVRVFALSRTDFMAVLRRNADLAIVVIRELSSRLRAMDEHASALSFQRVKERARGLLQRLAREEWKDGERLATPTLTHQQIADMIGTSRETVTRVVKELKQSGWLSQEGKQYLVPPEPK